MPTTTYLALHRIANNSIETTFGSMTSTLVAEKYTSTNEPKLTISLAEQKRMKESLLTLLPDFFNPSTENSRLVNKTPIFPIDITNWVKALVVCDIVETHEIRNHLLQATHTILSKMSSLPNATIADVCWALTHVNHTENLDILKNILVSLHSHLETNFTQESPLLAPDEIATILSSLHFLSNCDEVNDIIYLLLPNIMKYNRDAVCFGPSAITWILHGLKNKDISDEISYLLDEIIVQVHRAADYGQLFNEEQFLVMHSALMYLLEQHGTTIREPSNHPTFQTLREAIGRHAKKNECGFDHPQLASEFIVIEHE